MILHKVAVALFHISQISIHRQTAYLYPQLCSLRSKIDPIICVMSKLIICVLLSVIIQMFLYLILWPYYNGISVCIMIICNTLTVIFCFKHYQISYQRYCFICNYWCKISLYKFIYENRMIEHRNRAPTLSELNV